MSLRCDSSSNVPHDPVVDTDGFLRDYSDLSGHYVNTAAGIEGSLYVKPKSSSLSPNLGTPSRNVENILTLMRSEMDRIVIENFATKNELAKVRQRISAERRLREDAGSFLSRTASKLD